MSSTARVEELRSTNKKDRTRNEFAQRVDAHQSVLVRNGLKELLEPESPTSSRGNVFFDAPSPSFSLNRKVSGDLSSLSDRNSSSSPPLSLLPILPPPPVVAVTSPLVSHNISFLDDYKHLFTPGCVIGQVR